MGQRRTQGDAAAEAQNGHALRIRVEQERDMGEQPLRQHIARVGGIDLAVDGERCRASGPPDGNGAARALAVIEQFTGGERGARVRPLQHASVLIGTARQQQPIPLGEQQAKGQHSD